MTNAEKYLKDEMELKDFISDYITFCKNYKQDSVNLESLSLFFRQKVKPQLSEDERVILKNLHYEKGCYEYERIGRTKKDSEGYSDLYLIEKDLTVTNFNEYLHLFQFIKERRRILY